MADSEGTEETIRQLSFENRQMTAKNGNLKHFCFMIHFELYVYAHFEFKFYLFFLNILKSSIPKESIKNR